MSDPMHSPLTIVGAGPAGIMAAYTAAEAGAEVIVIDDNPLPGGQYYRQSPSEFKFTNINDASSGRMDAPSLYKKLEHPKIRTIYNTQVWGVFDQHTLALADTEKSYLIHSDRIILATGAYDRPMAFPGWTLPGVLGAGAALRMIKTQWVLPGKRVLLAGLGPLQLALADALVKLGVKVVCIAEAADPFSKLNQLPKFWGHWDRIGEAIGYMRNLQLHKAPLWFNHVIVEATGKDQVQSAKIARLNQQGMVIPSTIREYQVDAICLGYGLLPSFQLAAALGCQLCFDEHLQWYVPVHNDFMETTQPGIFVAGDVTDIAGAKVAVVQGKIAGLEAAYQLGFLDETRRDKAIASLNSELRSLDRLTSALHEIYAFRPVLNQLAKDDTLLCRCEEITYAQVKEALAEGAANLHQVKLHTRAGMGYCQSRFCSVLIAPLIAQATGQSLAEMQPFTVRPPIHPIPLKVLAAGIQEKVRQ